MKRVKQLMPLFRRQLSRHQHRSCNLCSKPAEGTTSLLDSYRKIQELLTNKDELVQHLCSNVVYEDDHIVSINKPAGLAMKAEKTSDNDARIINQVSLYQTLPDLRHHFNCPEMNIALPLPRNQSGVVIFGKDKKIVKKLDNKFFRSFADRHLYQKFHLISVGIPFNQSEDIQIMFLKQKEINNRRVSVPVDKVFINERKRGEAMVANFKMTLLSQTSKDVNCCYVELLTNTIRWNCCEVFMVQNLSPILGDHIYSSRVAPLLGQLVRVDPELTDNRPQKLPKTILNVLRMTVTEEDRISIPLHLHRTSVDILKFPTKLTETLTISAELPEHFVTALHSLKLDKS